MAGPYLCNRRSDLLKTSTNRQISSRYVQIRAYLGEFSRLVLVLSKSELRLERYGPIMTSQIFPKISKIWKFSEFSEIYKIFRKFPNIFGNFGQIFPKILKSSGIFYFAPNLSSECFRAYLGEIYRLVLVLGQSETVGQRYGPIMVGHLGASTICTVGSCVPPPLP